MRGNQIAHIHQLQHLRIRICDFVIAAPQHTLAERQAHLHEPEEVLELLDRAVKRHRAKELLVLTGEYPEVNPGVREKLHALGFDDFVGYVVWVCERAMERGLLPHTNLGVLSREDLGRLREVTASQGLMLESVVPDLVAHQGSPTKHPAKRLQTIRLSNWPQCTPSSVTCRR